MVNAVVLAGDRKGLPEEGVDNKAFIKIKGRYMIEYVIDFLRSAQCVDKIVVVGPESLRSIIGDRVHKLIECEDTMVKNIKKGISIFNDRSNVILCTSDIPMVSGEAVDDFVRQCEEKEVDIGYPIIEKSLNDTKYPDVKRTYVKLKDGIYTGGNIVYVNPAAFEKCYDIAEELIENRKNVIKMGKVFGIIIFIKLLLGILRISSVEKRVYKVFGIKARAIKTSYPEIGNDVDKMADVDFVNKYIA